MKVVFVRKVLERAEKLHVTTKQSTEKLKMRCSDNDNFQFRVLNLQ